jgi:acyl carrier protein
MMDEAQALDIVSRIVVTELAIPAKRFDPDTHLSFDLHIDTDDLSDLFIPAVERAFGIRLTAAQWLKIGTIRQTARAMVAALHARPSTF